MFRTPLELSGPLRAPRNMLSAQTYGDHASIHDETTAQRLGVAGAAIEGPTHFSQFDPLLVALWGHRWFETGRLSAHFQAICVEGEETRAIVNADGPAPVRGHLRTEKPDGTVVLSGTATLGPEGGATALEERLAKARPPAADPVIYAGWAPGRKGRAPERVRMAADTHMGDLYPFTLAQKLTAITEPSPWYESADTPWGRPIVPTEMISVLAMATFGEAGLTKAEPSVGLFLDLEIKMLAGPVFVDEPYVLEREVVALSESRRTESAWIRTTVTAEATGTPVAEVLLHQGVFKESYPDYPADRLEGR
ncbi:hypothetical protein J4573_43565 [Actinomadura barringtoniae]|uniref:MaoC-like domain-containing protein n=1 Tax=Actinomadura barringtoniae TaxID=1427535 RepID=A0A939PJT1_9ACTN|nr:hypothetical protein [Actinomadura barringtoniae]MBO2454031.1 hypothetical protein [Actinomadura barringtoniae]